MSEAEFAGRVHDELSMPGTCGVGFNSIRFDDEFTRNLLYRNFYDPYEREWKDGNSRWDIIDLARMAFALRPEGIEWPRRDDGKPSFRLEDLSAANGLTHAHAHDALSDVHATLGLARLIRQHQPKLWDFYFGLRQKQRVLDLLDWTHLNPVLHISSRYAADRGCHRDGGAADRASGSAEQGHRLRSRRRSDAAHRTRRRRHRRPRVHLARRIARRRRTHSAQGRLDQQIARAGADVGAARCRSRRASASTANAANVISNNCAARSHVAEKCRRVFATLRNDAEQPDPELAIYAGFACDADRKGFPRVRSTPPQHLGSTDFGFKDWRCAELLFRYRARNHPDSLSHDERDRWETFRRARLTESTPLTTLTFDTFFAEIAHMRLDPTPFANKSQILDELDDWGRELARELAAETLA